LVLDSIYNAFRSNLNQEAFESAAKQHFQKLLVVPLIR